MNAPCETEAGRCPGNPNEGVQYQTAPLHAGVAVPKRKQKKNSPSPQGNHARQKRNYKQAIDPHTRKDNTLNRRNTLSRIATMLRETLLIRRRLKPRFLIPLGVHAALLAYYWPLWEPSFGGGNSQSDVGERRELWPTPEEKRAGSEILRESGIVEHINGGQEWKPASSHCLTQMVTHLPAKATDLLPPANAPNR